MIKNRKNNNFITELTNQFKIRYRNGKYIYDPQYRHYQLKKCIIISFLFIFFMFLITNCNYPITNVNYLVKTNTKKNPTYFINMPSLGDHACESTIKSIFENADHPENIYIGIYQQNEENDPDCLHNIELLCAMDAHFFMCNFLRNIQIERADVKHGAKGPVYARHMTMKFYNNEDYILMIDSHLLFRERWDTITLNLFKRINNEYSVITHYPFGAENLARRTDPKQLKPHEMSYHICGSTFEGGANSMVRNSNGCYVKTNMSNIWTNNAIRVPFFAGGFSFAKSHFWKNVPLDPYLLNIFNGEEFDIATRGWTHGYDFYSPPFDIVGHYYSKGPKRRNPHVNLQEKQSLRNRDRSEKRINYKWGIFKNRYPNLPETEAELDEIEKYGLGNKRTIKQYWNFAGIDIINKQVTRFSETLYLGGGLPYIPWN